MKSNDKIIINELELYVHIGLSEKERKNAQKIVLSFELQMNLSKAAKSKRIEDTVNYFSLVKHIEKFLSSKEWILLEELSESLCAEILAFSRMIESVKVLTKKFVLKNVESVGIEIQRNK